MPAAASAAANRRSTDNLRREKYSYMFSLYEPGVMVLRMNANVKKWYFIRAKFCVTSSMQPDRAKVQHTLFLNRLEIHGARDASAGP